MTKLDLILNCKLFTDKKFIEVLKLNEKLVNKEYTQDDIKAVGNFLYAPNGQGIQLHRNKEGKFYNIVLASGERFKDTYELKKYFAEMVNNNPNSYPCYINNYYSL